MAYSLSMGLSMLGADSGQWLLSEVVLVLLLSWIGEVCWLLGGSWPGSSPGMKLVGSGGLGVLVPVLG